MSSRKELAGVRIDICSLREALHKIEHYLASEGLHAVETVSMKTVVTAGEDEQVRRSVRTAMKSEKMWQNLLKSSFLRRDIRTFP